MQPEERLLRFFENNAFYLTDSTFLVNLITVIADKIFYYLEVL